MNETLAVGILLVSAVTLLKLELWAWRNADVSETADLVVGVSAFLVAVCVLMAYTLVLVWAVAEVLA